jgi:hypothetical protein
MPAIKLGSKAYTSPVVGLPDILCENVFTERSRTMPDGQLQLVKRFGSLALPAWVSNARGYAQADGFASGAIIVVVGSDIKTYNPVTSAVGTITGSIAGSDRVVIAFTETQIGILGGGVFHVGSATSIAAVTDVDFAALLADHDQTAFADLMSIEQRFILIYGSRFCFTDVLDGGSTTALSYYTAEYAPDGLVACELSGERAMFLGGQTIEPWEATGTSTDPYRRSLGQIIPVGCRARDSVRVLDGALYWVDQNSQVRRTGSAIIPDTLSGQDITRSIGEAAASDIMSFVMEFEGHAMYAVRTPERCSLFDANYGEWVRFLTLESDTWRYGYALRVGGRLYLGDANGTGFAVAGPDYKSDHMPDADTMGTEIVKKISGYILTERERPMGKLRWEGSKGSGILTGQGSEPVIQLRRSLKGPKQFSNWRSRQTGAQGEYHRKVEWQQNGIIYPPGCTVEVTSSDPVDCITTGLYEDA